MLNRSGVAPNEVAGEEPTPMVRRILPQAQTRSAEMLI